MTGKTDLELIEEFRQGKVEGFNELVRRYQEKVYWVARRVIGSHDDADDVVQDVFVKVYAGLKDFRGEAGIYTWLYRITVNVALNALRKKKVKEFVRYDEFAEELNTEQEHADAKTLKEEYQSIFERAVSQLPPRQKLVFTLRYHDEIPYDEMAKMMKKSAGGLKANYSIALKKILEFMKRELNS